MTPDDSIVAKLGDQIPITVAVGDSFGTPQAGWNVPVYRSMTAPGSGAQLVTPAPTNAAGEVLVYVTSATGAVAGAVEQYSFYIVPTIGHAVAINNRIQANYTADGTITSLSVADLGGTVLDPTSVTNTTTAVVTAPLVTVPFGGTASTTWAQSYTVATGVNASIGTAGQVAAFRATPGTLTSMAVEVPVGSTGIYVSTTAFTLSSAGKSRVTVGADDTVYVFGTKAGGLDISFIAGGRTVTVPVKVKSSADAAYNIALSPAKQDVSTGAITRRPSP